MSQDKVGAVFDPMEEDVNQVVVMGEKDLWIDREQDDLLDVNDAASIFYDDFPPLPNFPCMSSSSSSSSTRVPVAATSSSSTATSSSVRHMDLGYMDLIDSNEIWDPSSVFQSENPQEEAAAAAGEEDGFSNFLQGNSELAMIFFQWLKQNKDYISADDMRSIKLKRSTIESASKRLGSTKEGKKQLLKLILEWVEQYQLHKKRLTETAPQSNYGYEETALQIPDPNFIYTADGYPNSSWTSVPDMQQMPAAAFPPPLIPYNSDPYPVPPPPPPPAQVVNGIPFQHSSEYPVMDHAQSWPLSPYPVPPPPQPQFSQQAMYGNPYQIFDQNGERMMRLGASATREARKKRMARQRRLYSHHHRHNSNSNQHQNHLNDSNPVGDSGDQAGDWMYWSGAAAAGGGGPSSPTPGNAPPLDAPQPDSGDRASMQPQNYQRQSSSDRRQQQGWKTEKNLKFLLQKVLKQSDVGNLGRIVLPKKEAEIHLPELESRDGISIAMEDIGSSRVWNMRYRFWPNNKSRMYLLENTGDFVRVNGLQEGDFIVIYSDTKCGKYMIRGVKVRQPGTKLEGKKPARRNMRNLSLAGNTSSLAPIKQAVR